MGARPFSLPYSGELPDSVRAVFATFSEIVRVRARLFAVEFEEELQRRTHLLVLASLAIAFLHIALLLLTAIVVVLFWETHPVGAIGAMAAVYLACGAAALLQLRARLAAGPIAFAATLSELDQDLAQLSRHQ